MSEQQLRARIRPETGCQRYVIEGRIFMAKRGWYAVGSDLAEKLGQQNTNVLNPTAGHPVFEVRTLVQAKAIESQETQKEDPRGTVDTPTAEPQKRVKPQPARRRVGAFSGEGDVTVAEITQAEPHDDSDSDDGPDLKEAAPARVGKRRAKKRHSG